MQPDAAAAGNLAKAQTQPDNRSAGADAKTWLDGLSEGNRGLAESKGWKEPGDIDKVFTSYAELEKLSGKSVQVPADDAPAEEWDAYLSKLPATMRPPESADKYEFKLPEGLPPDLPYNDTLATTSKEFMHKAKLSPSQAQAVHDGFVSYMAEQHKAEMARLSEAVEETHDALVKDWGPKDSEGFKQKHELANRAIKGLGLVEVFQEAGILLPDGALTKLQVAKAYLAVGEAMFKEDTIDLSGKADLGPNPFVKDARGKRNLTAISTLIKTDLPRATRLAKEAGENISVWTSKNPQ